jgi:histidinol dehydrogenase
MNYFRWNQLSDADRDRILRRPALNADDERRLAVARIIEQVRADGDVTLRALTRRFDGVEISNITLSEQEIRSGIEALSANVKEAIAEAYSRIRAFHIATMPQAVKLTTAAGVVCERVPIAMDSVGLYVPAGSAPLPSTALMLGIPAQLAGCPEIVLCSPPNSAGQIDAAVLFAASLCGITRVCKLGGVQAIAAMAYGTQSVPSCVKIFGPGNSWVTEAKRQVAIDHAGAAIDMPAGPSEVLIIADQHADANFVAADLLSQAEHGPDSQVILLSDSEALVRATLKQVQLQMTRLPRAEICERALSHSQAIVCDSLAQAVAIANNYAPEHLILQTQNPREQLAAVRNAGSVFLGAYTPESVGDYCSGTNHVLPTYGYAKAYSGLSVHSFVKFMTVQEVSLDGLRLIGPCAITLANAEGLHAHAQAVQLRLNGSST